MPALGAPALLAVTAPAHRCTEGNVKAGPAYPAETSARVAGAPMLLRRPMSCDDMGWMVLRRPLIAEAIPAQG